MEKIKKFVRERALKKFIIITGLLFAVWINFVIFAAITGKPFTLAHAQNTINVSLTVPPVSPVQKISAIETAQKQSSATDYKSSDYRLITTIPNLNSSPDENIGAYSQSPAQKVVLKKSTVTFRGKTIYPNSEIFLVISSDKIFTSVRSDAQGNWSWTNWCHPLENGEHSIEASNISPYDLSGKRDVFVQKYSFSVEAAENDSGMEELPLEDIIAIEAGVGENDFSGRLRMKNSEDMYLFDIALLNKREYNPGDEINMNMFFNPLGGISKDDARIGYEVYHYDENNAKETLVYSFEDSVNLSSSRAFLKKIKLKDDVQEGSYFIKVIAAIGEDKYVQSAKFIVGSKTLIQVGSTKIDEKEFSMAITWNVIFILGFAIIIFILIIFEYRQMSMCNLVDENKLRGGHYFSN